MFELLFRWIEQVRDAPGFQQWFPILAAILVLGFVIFSVGLTRRVRDGVSLRALNRTRKSERSGSAGLSKFQLPRTGDTVGRWVAVLDGRREQRLATRSGDVSALVAGTYDGLGVWLGYLRSTALMVGLLFTFIGLALTLGELSAALRGGQHADASNVMAIMDSVRGSLPGLATAFGSSVVGVIVAVILGLLESSLHSLRDGVEANLTTLSLEWLEGRLAPAGAQDAVAELSHTVNQMSQVLAQVTAQHAGTAELLRGGLARMEDVAAKLGQSTENTFKAVHTMEVAARNIAEQVGTTATELRSAAETSRALIELTRDTSQVAQSVAERVDKVFENAAGHFGTLQREASERFVALRDTVAKVSDRQLTAASAQLSAMGTASAHLSSATERLACSIAGATAHLDAHIEHIGHATSLLQAQVTATTEATGTLVTDLRVSATHVAGLTEAAKAFEKAQHATRNTVDSAVFFQQQLLEKVKETFNEVPRMTAAITTVALRQEASAGQLTKVLESEGMRRYLDELPRLAELAAAETESRRVLAHAVDSFRSLNETLEGFRDQVNRIGGAAGRLTSVVDEQVQHTRMHDARFQEVLQSFQDRYEALVTEAAGLAVRHLPEPVRAVIQATIEPQTQHLRQLEASTRLLDDITRAFTQEAHGVRRELRLLRGQHATPWWRRLAGRSHMGDA